MKNTIKKLPFILAFVVTIFAASCSDDVMIEPVNTDDDKPGIPMPPPPSGSSTMSSDTLLIG